MVTKLVYSRCHPSVFYVVNQKEKILLHHPHRINQAWKHNGEDLTEGNQGQGQTYEILLLFIPPPSVSSTLSVCWPISGADPKRLEKDPHSPIVSRIPHYLPHSAAMKGLGSCFPEVIISQHVSQPRLISACSPNRTGIFPAQAGPRSLLYLCR